MFSYSLVNIEIAPGEIRFLNRSDRQQQPQARLSTLLGSCVAITLWHPHLHIGGMSHCLLPNRQGKHAKLDTRYIDEAIRWFLLAIAAENTRPADYQVKLIGGGQQMPELEMVPGSTVGARNVEVAEHMLPHHGFRVHARHVEGVGHRRVVFDLDTGEVWVRHHKIR